MLPLGIIVNSLTIVVGGIIGKLLARFISEDFKKAMTTFLAFGAMTIGVTSMVKLDSLVIVVGSLLLGALLGTLMHLEDGLKRLIGGLTVKLAEKSDKSDDFELVSAIMIFCFSGTGIFGAITEGLGGGSAILLSKSVLDIFTAVVLATSLGLKVSILVIPQLAIFLGLYFLAGALSPILSAEVVADFVAVGGVITFMTGFNLLRIKEVKIFNCVLSLPIAMVLSYLINSYF